MCDTDPAEDAHGLVSGLGGWPLFPELAYGHLHHLSGLRICRSSQVQVNNARSLGRSAISHPTMAQAATRESRTRPRQLNIGRQTAARRYRRSRIRPAPLIGELGVVGVVRADRHDLGAATPHLGHP